MKNLLIFCLCMSLLSVVSLQNTTLSIIKKGLEFGKALVASMNEEKFIKFLQLAPIKIVPFLSAAVVFLEFVLSFHGHKESAELLAIKELYNEMDRRFDNIDFELQAIKKLIHFSRVKIQYSSIEQNILSESKLFQGIYTGPLANKESAKEYFLHSVENNCMLCAENLYQGLMGTDLIFSSDILSVVMQSLSYNRPETQKFMIGVLKLLIQGITNELAYRKIKYGDSDYMYHKSLWEGRLHNVTYRMIEVDEQIKIHYLAQSHTDVKELVLNGYNSHLSHQAISRNLYNFLVKKYDWRDWLVIVYDPVANGYSHANHMCHGFQIDSLYGHNVLIDSVDKSKPSMIMQDAVDKISNRATCHECSCSYRQSYYQASTIYANLSPETKDCSVYGSVGVVPTYAHVAFNALPNRLIRVDNGYGNYYTIYLFG